MAASGASRLVKEVIVVNGLPTVVSRISPKRKLHKHVIVVIPGNPGLVEFYDEFVTTLFHSLHGKWPLYAISHAGKQQPDTLFSFSVIVFPVCTTFFKKSRRIDFWTAPHINYTCINVLRNPLTQRTSINRVLSRKMYT